MRLFSYIIELSLKNRLMIFVVATLVAIYGFYCVKTLPIDILPDIDKTIATIVTEAPGMAPEEIESLVSLPLETALSGMDGVKRVRSSNTPSLSLINIEFGWNTDPYKVRQLIQERLQGVQSSLPEGITPIIAPIASVMGEIMMIGVHTKNPSISPIDLRTLADYTIARRISNISGVSQALATGGGLKQYRIAPNVEKMASLGVSFDELIEATKNAQSNTGGGIVNRKGTEVLVRNIGASTKTNDILNAVVKTIDGHSILLRDIAEVRIDKAQLRGDSAINNIDGIVITVSKQPNTDTIAITKEIENALAEIQQKLPKDTYITILYKQDEFIKTAVKNVEDAIIDGAIMVVAILFIFLLSIRTTIITITAIPLSVAMAAIYFHLSGSSINTMTLGGLAVAIGMLVDDAIVDVENVHRRLRENSLLQKSRSRIAVILDACVEIRASIFYATALIVIVFAPTFGLSELEGKMFAPLSEAVIVSMIASFIVALTVIPALCSLLLKTSKNISKEPIFSRIMKAIVGWIVIKPAIKLPHISLILTATLTAAAFALFPLMGRDFIPPLNEGGSLLIVQLSPESSIDRTKEIASEIYKRISDIPELKTIGMKIGRAEKDDHAEPVNVAKFILSYKTDGRSSSQIADELRKKLDGFAGISYTIGQPMAHRIDYMLSGTQSQIAVKIFGDDMQFLLQKAEQLSSMIKELDDVKDVNVEKQSLIEQIKISVDREKAALYGVQVGKINNTLKTILGGESVAEVLDGNAVFDVFVRLNENEIVNSEKIGSILIENSSGEKYPLSAFAKIENTKGFNHINREGMKRKIVVGLNADDGSSVRLAEDIREIIDTQLNLPDGYYATIEGQFQNRIDAGNRILALSLLALLAIFALLYTHFGNISETLQVMFSIPIAFAGGLFTTWYFIGTMSVASLIGMIALAGIAARNTIMMISHYNHLMLSEGEDFSSRMILRGTLERFNPIMMTALTAALALLPLMHNPESAGKELLYPVAVMIVGGLTSSTLLSFVATPAAFKIFGRKPKV